MRTANSEVIEQSVDVLLMSVGRDAVSVDGRIVTEAGYVSGSQTGANVDQ